ncbi:hypothetical protein GGR44_003259 [Sphingobium fontiphilum]|uniref:Uncharacterized protein n=1 Tax=Sphingobium fontiphilum TaxID=944425 RepID=A0A7W6GQI4_9SPHN|nr:hypothetical protein [Sphingobium fontiphilum]MBB3983568.1 hypothetical protein [Sphingobium fontiphilum]
MTGLRPGFVLSLSSIAIALTPAPAPAQVASVTTVAASVRLLRGQIDALIASARQDMDLVLFNAGVEARDALDAWERVNSSLMDKAFAALKDEQKQLFLNIQKAVADVNDPARNRLEQAQQLTDTAVLTVNSLPFSKKSFITRYTPRLIFPGGREPIVLRVFGPHMQKAEPRVTLAGGQALDMIEGTALSASFPLPNDAIDNAATGSTPLQLKVSHYGSPYAWFGKDRTSTKLAPWILPHVMGSYTVTPLVEKRETERKMVTLHSGRLSGRNRNVHKGVHPPEGWKFDLDRMDEARVRGDGGEAGRCEEIANNDRSENGVLIKGRVDEIRQVTWRGVRWEDGWIRCIATLPVYRVVPREEMGEPVSGQLGWYEDVAIAPPPGIKSWTVAVTLFDGRSRTVQGPASDLYFDLSADHRGVILSPKRPVSY